MNQLFADVDAGVLKIGLTGNLEGNFNKGWIFIDGVGGGESVLAGDNVDGGFNEIQNLAGYAFANGASMDHGIRLEVGGGFLSVRFFDLIDNTAFDVQIGFSGPGDLPFSNSGAGGVTAGWDNSNVLGVSDSDASTAATATTGWEFEIDLATAFGSVRPGFNIEAFVTSGDATFVSNQVLAGNIVPEPSTALIALLGAAGLAMVGRRQS